MIRALLLSLIAIQTACVGTPHNVGVVLPSEYPAFRGEVDSHQQDVFEQTVSYEHYRTGSYEEAPAYQLAIWYEGAQPPARPGVHEEIELQELAATAVGDPTDQ